MSTLKHKGKGPQALTANGLRAGPVVYLDPQFLWTTSFENALKTEDPDMIEQMQAIGERDDAANIVVGVYFIDIDPQSGLPARYREKFRANGPSFDPGRPTHKERAEKDGPIIL